MLADAGFHFPCAGKAQEGTELIYQAMRINPHYTKYHLIQLGMALFDARKYEEAITTFARLRDFETPISCLYLAASLTAFGKTDKAKEAIDRILQCDLQATIKKWMQSRTTPFIDPEDPEHFDRNLRKPGLPE